MHVRESRDVTITYRAINVLDVVWISALSTVDLIFAPNCSSKQCPLDCIVMLIIDSKVIAEPMPNLGSVNSRSG